MAERKSAKMVKARQRAQELAQADLDREQKLIEKAAEFFAAFESVELADEQLETEIMKIRAEAEKKISAAREKSAARSESARAQAAAVASEMLDLGLPQKKVADRLGLSAAALRKLLAEIDQAPSPAEHAVKTQTAPVPEGVPEEAPAQEASELASEQA